MTDTVYKMLESEVRVREDRKLIESQDRLAGIYEGTLPPEFERFFPQNTPKQMVNLVRLAWDDLATSIGRLPDFRGETENNTDKEERFIGKLERIGHSYLRAAKPSGKMFMWQLAWYLIGLGRAVAIVTPDEERKMPRLTIRDPRYVYPGIKETAGNQVVELNDLMFKYELTRQEMENRGFKVRGKETRNGWEPNEKGTIIEYIDKDQWILASDGGTVKRSEHNLGRVPGWLFQTHAPDKNGGLSQFEEQITFMVSISRMLSQKMRYADRLAHPVVWVKGHEGTLELGPDVINKLSPQGEMGQLSPPVQLQVDRDIELLNRLSRVLNRNPEVRQGEVQSKGSYTSAKTLEQLAEAIDTVIGRMWDIISVGMQELTTVMFMMDEKLWPNVEKSITGKMRNRKYSDKYTPSVDIDGRHFLNVDYGFGLGGYQGFLMQVQMLQAKLQSRKGAMEEMPGISDVDDKMREIELEDMDNAGAAGFMAQAQQGQLDMLLWAKLRDEMAKKGTPLSEAIQKYQEEIRQQAQEAVEAGGAEALATPGSPEGAQPGPPGGGGPPGLPPAALMGV